MEKEEEKIDGLGWFVCLVVVAGAHEMGPFHFYTLKDLTIFNISELAFEKV